MFVSGGGGGGGGTLHAFRCILFAQMIFVSNSWPTAFNTGLVYEEYFSAINPCM